jgi:hypothetical protein
MTKFVFALVFMTAGLAQAYTPCPAGVPAWECDHVNPNPVDRWPDRDLPGHAPDYGHAHPIACAPEVIQGNVAATQRTLTTLAASREFANASKFKSIVSNLASIHDDQVRIARYFALIGIDSKDSAAVADFAGSREVRAQWLSSLEKSAQLTSAQSDVVASKLQSALRGDLR